MNTTLTHNPSMITQLLPVVIACLFFAAGWLGATVRAQAKAARLRLDRERQREQGLRRRERLAPGVVSDPSILGGIPVIEGTRVDTETIAAWLR